MLHELHIEKISPGPKRHRVTIAGIPGRIETVFEQLPHTTGSQNHGASLNEKRLAVIINAARPKTSSVLDDEIRQVGLLDDDGLCCFNYCLLDGDNPVRTAGLWVCVHCCEHLALESHPHFAQPFQSVRHLVDEHATQCRIGHAQSCLNHVGQHSFGRIEEATLWSDGANRPEVAERI